MKAERCPVCNGSGEYHGRKCHGCNGKGWVTVPNIFVTRKDDKQRYEPPRWEPT